MYMNHAIKKLVGAVAVASTLVISPVANAVVMNFDDLSGGCCNSIPNGYGGFQWTNFGSHGNTLPGTGYNNGVVSGSNTAFNLSGTPASFSSATAFNLSDAFFTSAWNNGLQVHVEATASSGTYTKDFTINTSGPLDVFFNWSNIYSVTFFSSGGVLDPNLSNIGTGTHFAMDNLNVSPVPEPETYAMLLVGLGLLGFTARRRKGFTA